MNAEMAKAASSCDPSGPLIIHVTKLYPDPTLSYFNALGYVFSGTAQIGQHVKVLGEHYSLEDEEDMSIDQIQSLNIGESMYAHLFFFGVYLLDPYPPVS